MPDLAGRALPYVNKVYGAVNRGLIGIGKRGRRPLAQSDIATRQTLLSGAFGSEMPANSYYRRRGIAYVGGTVGTAAGVRGLRSRSSGGSGELPSQNMPMY